MRYSTLIKQIFVVAKTRWIFTFFSGKLFSLASYEVITNLRRIAPKIDFIIDVGANSGQFTQVVNHFYPKAKIESFEPIPEFFLKIEKKFASNKNIIVHNQALGNEEGEIGFYRNKFGHISSILEISSDNIHYPKEENDLDQIKVKINTLDKLYFSNDKISGVSLLKLDVQGYELEVLKGGKRIIQEIDYIIIEANLEQLYKEQPTFTEINKFLNDKNFEVIGMLDFNLGNKNKYIEIDLLYKNTAKI